MMNGLLLRASGAFCASFGNKNHGVSRTGMEWFLGFVEWSYLMGRDFTFALSAEMWVSLAAISVAVWTGRQSQLHAGLSVVPAFATWGDYPRGKNRQCVIRISNKGFGPAIVERVEIFYKGMPIEGYMYEKMRIAVEHAFGDQVVDIPQVAADEKGHAFGAGDETILARFTITDELAGMGAEGIGEKMKHLALALTYQDIYGRWWYYLVREFEGKTWRRNSPAHLVNFFRYRRYL